MDRYGEFVEITFKVHNQVNFSDFDQYWDMRSDRSINKPIQNWMEVGLCIVIAVFQFEVLNRVNRNTQNSQ